MRVLPGLAVALALCSSAAHADGRLDIRNEGTCPMMFASIEVAGPRLRFELTPHGGEAYASIFDGDEDLVTSLMPSQRRYMRMEVDADAADYSGDVASSSVKFMDRQIAQAQAQMKAQCGNNCPALPDLDALMRAGMPAQAPALETRDTGEAGSEGGVACAWREWLRDGAVVRRECLADITALPLPDRDRAGLRRGMKVMLQFNAAYAPFRERFGLDREPLPVPGKLAIAQVCMADGVESGRATVVASEGAVDPARFEVPADYQPVMGPGAR